MILLSRAVPPRAQNIDLFCYWRLDGETFVKQHRGITALVDRPPVIVEFAIFKADGFKTNGTEEKTLATHGALQILPAGLRVYDSKGLAFTS
jgi:hypothetical protein